MTPRHPARSEAPVFLATMLITAALIGGLAFFAVRRTAPEEPLGRELARVVPLSLVVGVVLAWASSI
jgi:hypothetical protein